MGHGKRKLEALVRRLVGVWRFARDRRPSLEPYRRDILPVQSEARLSFRYAGVTTLLFDDGETAWMTDGFFSRPSVASLGAFGLAIGQDST
jgi:hypothetical protein